MPAGGLRHGDHGRDGGKRHTHHHRQANAEPLRGPHGLNQRDQAAHEQVGRDQVRHLLGRQIERAPHDERHGHGACIHDQHVLQTQRGHFAKGELFVNGMNG
ncbi:hypothetical protein SDC9_112743 [bioreactor metagenome]|uniref:Uncharacterized protein n=1 Tax=bioreactor metagenome TaxID=1076179 RepID=A0A645BK33_9ZZZZ